MDGPNAIRLLYKPESPVAPAVVRGHCSGADLELLLGDEERATIDEEWRAAERMGCFSKRGGLGSLWDSSNPVDISFRPVEYKTYFAACRRPLGAALRRTLRIAAVGAAVRTADGKYLVHRRPADSAHLPALLDCSAAGLCPVNDDTFALDFGGALLEKLARELGLTGGDIADVRLTAIHTVPSPSWSGLFSFRVDVRLTSAELIRRCNPRYLHEVGVVEEEALAVWVVNQLCETRQLLADGAVPLLASLPHPAFLQAVEAIRRANGVVTYGRVRDGTFNEETPR